MWLLPLDAAHLQRPRELVDLLRVIAGVDIGARDAHLDSALMEVELIEGGEDLLPEFDRGRVVADNAVFDRPRFLFDAPAHHFRSGCTSRPAVSTSAPAGISAA